MQDAEQGPLFPRPLDEPVADCLVAPQIARDAAESLLLDQGLLAHHIDSMNSFWSKELPQIVQENATIVYEYKKGEERWVVRFSHLEIERPTMTDAQGTVHRLMPHEALLLRQTYAAKQRNTITVWKQVRMLKKLVPDQVIDRDSDIPLASTAQLVQDGPAAAALSEDRIVVLTKKRQQKYYWHTVEEYINRDCRFCDIPVMIGSSPCYLSDGTTSEDKNLSVDPRGYFVVEGQEKVCIAQEKPRYNRVFVYRDQPKTPFKAEIRSMHEFKIRSTSTLVVYCCRTQANDRFQVKLPYLDLPVRIDAILRMLGYECPEQAALAVASWGMMSGFTASSRMDDMERMLDADDYRVYRYFLNALQNDVVTKGHDVWSMNYVETAQLIARLGSNSKQAIATDPVEQFKHVHHLMGNEFLPHIGYKHEHETRVRKRRFFAMMMGRLCRVAMGMLPPDDREFYGNKLIETSGWLMSLYYRQLCRHVCRKILNYIRKCVKKNKTPDVAEYVATTTSKKMSENFRYSIATGKWGIKRKRVSTHAVVTQQMKRMVFMATLGNLRKINTPMSHKGRNPKPRQLHYSQHGIVCLAKTPEGAPVGLLKNLAMGARISGGCMSHVVMTAIMNRVDLMEMIETFPGSEFNYDMGGLTAMAEKNIFAVPSQALGIEDDSGRPGWPQDGFNTLAHKKFWLDREVGHDRHYFARKHAEDANLFLNGMLIGRVSGANVAKLINMMRGMRRALELPVDTSVAYNRELKEIYVATEAGILRRPLFVLDTRLATGEERMRAMAHKVRALWNQMGRRSTASFFRELVARGMVEYLDKMEEQNCLVKADPSVVDVDGTEEEPVKRAYTHCVIHSLLQYSEMSTSMVFLDRAPTPRATYQSNMAEASIGVSSLDAGFRSSVQRLLYPSRPIVQSCVDGMLRLEDVPCVQNIVIAVMPLRFNEEDAVVLSEEAVQFGFGWNESFRTYQEVLQDPAYGPRTQKFGRPAKQAHGRKRANYDKIDEDGLPAVGTSVSEYDVVIGKQVLEYPLTKTQSQNDESVVQTMQPKEIDMSLLAKRFEHDALCESVFVAPLENKKRLAQVRTNKLWVPEVGDKFSSRHGQKGVVGAILPTCDMPFCARTGIRPTLLINSHAFPSRMTLGHIEEVFMGKCAALTSSFADGTAHHPVDEEALGAILESYGYARSGKERMISGITGEEIEADIFVGVQSYQRLKQVVHDKEQARARGPRNLKTRQPVEGRSYEGGMRLGEMERDVIISHGAASTLQERLLFQSDNYIATVCKECGVLADPAFQPSLNVSAADEASKQRLNESTLRARRAWCRECKSSRHIRLVRMPYIFKVVLQETYCMGIKLKLELKDSVSDGRNEWLSQEPMAPSIGMNFRA